MVIVPLTFFSTEDWRMQVTAVDANGNAFDLTGYNISCDFREQPNSTPIAELTLGHGITLGTSSNVINLVSYVGDRSFSPTAARTTIYGDIMIANTINSQLNTTLLGRIPIQIVPGVTHD